MVGIYRGASYVQDGITGYQLKADILPPGLEQCKEKREYQLLMELIAKVHAARELDRGRVRAAALEQFDTAKIVERILQFLQSARR